MVKIWNQWLKQIRQNFLEVICEDNRNVGKILNKGRQKFFEMNCLKIVFYLGGHSKTWLAPGIQDPLHTTAGDNAMSRCRPIGAVLIVFTYTYMHIFICLEGIAHNNIFWIMFSASSAIDLGDLILSTVNKALHSTP